MRPLGRRPGIHNHGRRLWIPGSRRRGAPRNDEVPVKIIYPEDVVLRVRRSTGCRRRSPSKRELPMQYLLLIYRNEAEQAKMDAAARKNMLEDYGAFTQS